MLASVRPSLALFSNNMILSTLKQTSLIKWDNKEKSKNRFGFIWLDSFAFFRLRDLTRHSELQLELLRLIIQKMEIQTENDFGSDDGEDDSF